MTLAPADPSRATTPADTQDRVAARTSAWYDPDAAAFDFDDPLADLDPDEEAIADFGWR
jgi:hypothetical protein